MSNASNLNRAMRRAFRAVSRRCVKCGGVLIGPPLFLCRDCEHMNAAAQQRPIVVSMGDLADDIADNPQPPEPTPMDPTSFFLVWREPDSSGGDLYARTPTRMHPLRETAMAEARRLAERHPGARFHVCEAIATVQAVVPAPTVTLRTSEVTPADVARWRAAVGLTPQTEQDQPGEGPQG